MAILNLANLSFHSGHLAGASKLIDWVVEFRHDTLIGIPETLRQSIYCSKQFHNHMVFALLTLVSHVNPT